MAHFARLFDVEVAFDCVCVRRVASYAIVVLDRGLILQNFDGLVDFGLFQRWFQARILVLAYVIDQIFKNKMKYFMKISNNLNLYSFVIQFKFALHFLY